MSDGYTRAQAFMGTVVSVEIVGHGTSQRARRARSVAVDHAMQWFRDIETSCSRFDVNSEVRRLSTHIGEPVPVSPLLFEAVQFALAVATQSHGAFDPTVGTQMESRGFNRAYQDNAMVSSDVRAPDDISFRDVSVHANTRTITLHRPLLLDLGAVAKGLAVDMAAKSLAALENFVVSAGGDLYAGGVNARGEPWAIGIPDPHDRTKMIETMRVSDSAICTSGNYERRNSEHPGEQHIINPVTRTTATGCASVTVTAPSAMVADAMATTAFVLGPVDGVAFLERHGVAGMLITETGERLTTSGAVHV